MTDIITGNPIKLIVSGLPGKLTAADRAYLDLQASSAAADAADADASASSAGSARDQTIAAISTGLARYYVSTAAAVADSTLAVGQPFFTDASGSTVFYRKTGTSPFYVATTIPASALGVSPGGTVQDMVDPVKRMLKRLPQMLSSTSLLTLSGRIDPLLDSLTQGAGSFAPTTWRFIFDAIMRANLGYGGPGYEPFNFGVAVEKGAGYNITACNEFSLGDGTAPDIAYSAQAPGGYGILVPGAGSSFFWVPESQWKTAALVHRVGPDMGAFKWNYTTLSGSTAVTVDCYHPTPMLGFVSLTAPTTASCGISVSWVAGTTNPTGPAVLYGADWIYNAAGYRPGYMAKGGRLLQWVAGQDMAALQQFYTHCPASAVLPDGGMNDRGTRTAAQHQTDWTTVLTAIKAGCAAAAPAVSPAIVMVQSLDPSDAATTNFASYTAAKIAVAKALDCAYLDDRYELGVPDYATASANGFMNTDGIHPTGKANIGKAQVRGRAFGASLALPDPGKLAYTSGSTATLTQAGTITTQANKAVAAPVSAVTGAQGTVSGATLTITTDPTSGAFAVGQMVNMTGLPAGTLITAGSGTSWTLSNSATIASATAVTGYTVTRNVLWKLGLVNGSPQAFFTFTVAAIRASAGSMKKQRHVLAINNLTTANAATSRGPITTTLEAVTTAGDGQSYDYILDVTINGGFAEVGITSASIGFAGLVTVTGSYLFAGLSQAGQSVFEN